ncbi:MAG: hypothetical protein AAGF67_10545, partial [Verrucomicrobiota bacterium]
MTFTTLQPLLWLLVIVPMAAGIYYSLVDRPSWAKFGSFGLRVLAVILLALALCRPFTATEGEDLHTIFLVDVSESIQLGATIGALTEVENAIEELGPNDSWTLQMVASGTKPMETTEELRTLLEDWDGGIADDQYRSSSTLADSLLNTRLGFPAGKAKRIVLFSDGQDTSAEVDKTLTNALETLTKEDVDVRFRRTDGLDQAEAAVVSVDPSTPSSFENEIVRLRVEVASNRAMKARLRILHKGVSVQERSVDLLDRPDNRFEFDVTMTTPGPSVWTAELIPESDFFPINNQLGTTITVQGKPRLLAIHREPKEMRSFARALREQEFEVEVRGNFGLPESMEQLLAFDSIVLADVPATDLTIRQMNLLKQFVSDFGGGVAMLGSDNSFGLGGYYKTPVEEVLPLTSRFEKEKEKPSLAMVLVIDKSGSMGGLPIQLARQAAK